MAREPLLRGAMIGYGYIAEYGHVPAYLRRGDVEIVAVADICEPRRQRAQLALPRARVYASATELLAGEEKLDFVDIATPPAEHAGISREALSRGLHVLCEKPLTTTTSDARELLERARIAKRVLFPCHNYKYAPVIREVRAVLASGRIGRVRSVTLQTFRNTHAKGVPQWRTHWRRDPEASGGGIAMDHGSHSFYLAFEWLGEYPIAVAAKTSNEAARRAGRHDASAFPGTEDTFSASLTFPSGIAHLILSWDAGVRKTIYTLQGEKGAIRIEDDDLEIAVMRPTLGLDVAQGAVAWDVERRRIASNWMDASHQEWFSALFDEFRRAIAARDYTGKDAYEAYLCVQLINESYRSARMRGVEVPLNFGPLNAWFTAEENLAAEGA